MSHASEIAEGLRARRVGIEQTILGRIGATSNPTEKAPAEYLMAQRAALAAIVEYGLAGVEQGARWESQIPSAVVTQARCAARLGVPHETVLRHCVAVHTQLEDHVMEEAERVGLPGHGAALRGIHTTQGLMLGHLIAAIADAYAQEERRAQSSPEQRRAERVRRVLAGERIDAVELGYELDVWHLGLIATGGGAVQVVRDLARLARSSLCVPIGERTAWAWLGGPRKLTVADVHRGFSATGSPAGGSRDASLAVGEPGEGVEGFRRTHRQAQAALSVALCRPQPFTRYADVALLTPWVNDADPAGSLVDVYLAPLYQARNGATLRATLRAYVDAGRNVKAAAAALGVDRGTVAKRLNTIESLYLGHPLDQRMAELEVALCLEELHAARSKAVVL